MDIFYTHINQLLKRASFESYLETLPETARLRILRFQRWQDAHASLFGFLLLKDALDKLGFDGSKFVKELVYDGKNKPRLPNGMPDFNISHAGDLVVCAVSTEGNLGVDIEQKKELDIVDFDNCWRPEEIDWLNRQKDQLSAFFYLWTRKEAVVKAFGKGLFYDLKDINVLNDKVITNGHGTWFLQPFHIDESYSGHVAFSREPVPLIGITRRVY